MSYEIDKTWSAALLDQPETGMGYQIVEVQIPQGAEHVVVLNAQRAMEVQESPRRFREGANQARKMRVDLALKSKREDTPFRVLELREAVTKGLVETRAYAAGKEPASEATPVQSGAGEEFLRFSAFKDDARIDHADGSVLPGTYVTTQTDGLRVKTGKEAVERYALPNPDPAVHRFWLKPPRQVQVRRGTVQPANGHQGSGDEVIFDNGAPAGTKQKQDEIPPGE
ncbi:MAG: hypothetical protein WD773_03620 [Gemmatimonadales bacterium]